MSFETLIIIVTAVGTAIVAAIMVAVLGRGRHRAAAAALSEGDFSEALRAGSADEDLGERIAAAVAAKHLGELATARKLLRAALDEEPDHGEAWMELGLAAAYARQEREALRAFGKAESLRSDLLESLTLHRAWLALACGRGDDALRLFSDIEIPLETKLRQDIGGGEPLFAEWFLQASALWAAAGQSQKALWAEEVGRESAPGSQLAELLLGVDQR